MDTALEWLVLIISVMLGIFLLLSIFVLLKLLSIFKDLKRVSQKAEGVADSVDIIAKNIRKVAPIAALAKLFYQINRHSKKGD